MSKKLDVITFGCRLNTYESEIMRQQALKAQLETLPEGAVLINTCSVTSEAVRQARQTVRKIRRKRPHTKIIVSGCAAQTEPETFGNMPEVDLVLGNQEKLLTQSYRALPEFGINDFEKIRVNDIMSVRETAGHMIKSIDKKTRAFVQIQNGCDHRCTFCIIPYGRGNSRSVPMGSVVRQVKLLVENNYREVVLSGVDLTSYGPDLPGQPCLADLVSKILKQVPELPRLRLSSIDSIEVNKELMNLITSEKRLMPYLHLSLQSGDDMILKRMKRRHSRSQAVNFCNTVRSMRSDVAFGADIIAGFPTETEAMFRNSLSLINDCDLSYIHVFPFSPRPGTPAARMPQLDTDLIKERACRLRERAQAAFKTHLEAQLGHYRKVLVENQGNGRSEQFTPVEVFGVPSGSIVNMKITGHNGRKLTGKIIDNDPGYNISCEV